MNSINEMRTNLKLLFNRMGLTGANHGAEKDKWSAEYLADIIALHIKEESDANILQDK